jgi:hypothetical protein
VRQSPKKYFSYKYNKYKKEIAQYGVIVIVLAELLGLCTGLFFLGGHIYLLYRLFYYHIVGALFVYLYLTYAVIGSIIVCINKYRTKSLSWNEVFDLVFSTLSLVSILMLTIPYMLPM